jgi:hypothetical protein
LGEQLELSPGVSRPLKVGDRILMHAEQFACRPNIATADSVFVDLDDDPDGKADAYQGPLPVVKSNNLPYGVIRFVSFPLCFCCS